MVYQTAPFSMTLNDPKPRFQSQALTLNISVMVNPCIALLFLRTPVALGCKKYPSDVYVLEQQICWISKANLGFSTMAS